MDMPPQKSGFLPSLATASYLVLAVPVGLAIIVALWLTAQAAYENVKFVRCTDQLLSIIGTARSDAAADTSFGQKPDEDLIDDFLRRAQLSSPPVNEWGGDLRAQAKTPLVMRIETDVPMSICRRLALFFGKDASAFKLQKMAARSDKNGWSSIFDAAGNESATDYKRINAACGEGGDATLALTLNLR